MRHTCRGVCRQSPLGSPRTQLTRQFLETFSTTDGTIGFFCPVTGQNWSPRSPRFSPMPTLATVQPGPGGGAKGASTNALKCVTLRQY